MSSSTSTLAEGCFGKVYKQRYNGQWAAIKKIPVDHEAVDRKDILREYKVYKEAVHPNIVKILGPITIESRKYVIPLEFIFGEDLETTIFQPQTSKIQLSADVRRTIAAGMCDGLRYLHSKDIVHQDLKPDNIMVEHGTNRAIIIDLGLAKFYKNGLNSAMNLGNWMYSAPELLRGGQRDRSSDVWAMGKVMAELHLMRRLKRDEVCPPTVGRLLKDETHCALMCSMVKTDPAQRVSMDDDAFQALKPSLFSTITDWCTIS